MFLIVALFLLLGLALTALGLRGRLVDDHPLCRRCGFDLYARPADSVRCPECGADLTHRRPFRLARRRRRLPLIVGAIILLPVTTYVGLTTYRDVTGIDWLNRAPLWYVLRRAKAIDSASSPAAMRVLQDRIDGQSFSDADWRRVAEAGLELRAKSTSCDGRWSGWIESAHARGLLTDQQWSQFLRQSIDGLVTARIRARVRSGDRLLFQIVSGYDARDPEVWFRLNAMTIRCADDPSLNATIALNQFGRLGLGGERVAHGAVDAATLASLARQPGAHMLEFDIGVDVGEYSADRTFHAKASGHVTDSRFVEFLPPGQFAISSVPDPSRLSAIARSLSVKASRAVDKNNQPIVVFELESEACDVNLAFDVFVRSGGRTALLGSLVHPTIRCGGSLGLGVQFVCPADAVRAGEVDLVFRSNPFVANEDIEVESAWAGEVVVPATVPPR